MIITIFINNLLMNGVGQEITSSGLFKKNVYNENDPC